MPAQYLQKPLFGNRKGFFEDSAIKLIGVYITIIEIPTTIKSTIFGKTRAINMANIPKYYTDGSDVSV
jgi:hypothetical protein